MYIIKMTRAQKITKTKLKMKTENIQKGNLKY